MESGCGEILRTMSRENVETVKEFSRLFEEGDREKWRAYFEPDVVWDTSASDWPTAGVLHGHEGVEQFFRDWLGTWTDYEVEFHEFLDAGDSVVVVFRQSGTGRESGIHTDREFFAIYDLERSKVVRYRMYDSRAEALEAAGLSE
jgi:ketosteroid isomerase-like protein